jgi:hypothetical protein
VATNCAAASMPFVATAEPKPKMRGRLTAWIMIRSDPILFFILLPAAHDQRHQGEVGLKVVYLVCVR